METRDVQEAGTSLGWNPRTGENSRFLAVLLETSRELAAKASVLPEDLGEEGLVTVGGRTSPLGCLRTSSTQGNSGEHLSEMTTAEPRGEGDRDEKSFLEPPREFHSGG